MTELRRADGGDLAPSTLRASWMRLPALWWRDVPLIAAEPVELSPLDQFMVDATTRRGRMTHEEFTRFTGFGAQVFGGLARRLGNLGLVGWADGVVTPLEEGQRLIAEGAVRRTRTIVVDLLYLPHTDDLIVVEEGLAEFERSVPRTLRGGAPLPDHLLGLTRDGFLADRIAGGQVVNLSPQVVGLAPESVDEPLHAMAGASGDASIPLAPAIRCSVTLHHDGEQHRVVLERRSANDNDPIAVSLGAAEGIAAALRDIENDLGRTPTVLPLGVESLTTDRLTEEVLGRWLLPVTGEEAATLAEEGSLTTPIGIETRTEYAHVITSIELRAADSVAAGLLAIDAFLDELLADPANVRHLVTRERPDEETALRRRAWELGHFWVVHALREREDFSYA